MSDNFNYVKAPAYPTHLENLAILQGGELPATVLPPNYTPGELDICCGRGKRNWNHSGNVAFRNLIHTSVDRYLAAPTKTAKSAVVLQVVDTIRESGAYFLKQNETGVWYDIGDAHAREKVGHSLRDQVTARSKMPDDGINVDGQSFVNRDEDDVPSMLAIRSVPAHVVHVGMRNAGPLDHAHAGMVDISNGTAIHPDNTYSLGAAGGSELPQEWMRRSSYNAAANSFARRPSEVWSDFGCEEQNRRSTLESTALLEDFGRRPSWLAMSFVDTPSSSLQSAAMQAAIAVQQEEEEERRQRRRHEYGDETPVVDFPDSMYSPSSEKAYTYMDDRRASAISMMSTTDAHASFNNSSFTNVFRSSLRKSSVSWGKELQQMNWAKLELGSSQHDDDAGPRSHSDEMLRTLERLLGEKLDNDTDMGNGLPP
jgi:hypothetical protein